jgi:hypothetical protein
MDALCFGVNKWQSSLVPRHSFPIVWVEKRAWYTLCAHAPTNITFMGGAFHITLKNAAVSSLFLTVFFHHFGDDKKPQGGRLTPFARVHFRC